MGIGVARTAQTDAPALSVSGLYERGDRDVWKADGLVVEEGSLDVARRELDALVFSSPGRGKSIDST